MTPLTALLVFIGTFLFVAIVFVIPVSYALGIASMVVFMLGAMMWLRLHSMHGPPWTAFLSWQYRFTYMPVH